ncbi:ATP-binding protein [Actinomadura fulvescens]|uniref:sensor histidine kinase n=1 Tax=Actinomadura fulvescens TaxID=46160 RepID=UPI0031CE8333
MGFRARVFAIVTLVTLVAIATTAWLTVRTTTAEFTDSAAAAARDVDTIEADLVRYGSVHGTWEGVPHLAEELKGRTRQRIRLAGLSGDVIVDTDTLEGRTARPTTSRPASVLDPRRELVAGAFAMPASGRRTDTPPGAFSSDPPAKSNDPSADPSAVVLDPSRRPGDSPVSVRIGPRALLARLSFYRSAIRLRACYTREGVQMRVRQPIIWSRNPAAAYVAGIDDDRPAKCAAQAKSTKAERAADHEAALACGAGRTEALGVQDPSLVPEETCEGRVFLQRLESVAPEPLLIWLGHSEPQRGAVRIPLFRVATAASVVAVLLAAGTLLLSRRVLAPIATLRVASGRLGAGDLSERVRVRGHDEIAALGRTFNRMADSLQRSEEAQRRMISDIAHELRTPLSTMRGYLEALQDGVLKPDQELLASLHEEAVLQQRLIDDLQDLALAESGALRMRLEPLDAVELLETYGFTHRVAAESRGVLLLVETAPVPPVNGDADRLRQVVGNLVTNALAATPPGGTITLRAGPADDDGVLISVADTGHGIGAEDLRNVFDRFWRADAARGRGTGGRGLGLSIAKGIVAAHGGTLSAESTTGAGSTFTVRLPPMPPPDRG